MSLPKVTDSVLKAMADEMDRRGAANYMIDVIAFLEEDNPAIARLLTRLIHSLRATNTPELYVQQQIVGICMVYKALIVQGECDELEEQAK